MSQAAVRACYATVEREESSGVVGPLACALSTVFTGLRERDPGKTSMNMDKYQALDQRCHGRWSLLLQQG
jgi:hypothetical protein